MRWLKSIFRPKPTRPPIQSLSAKELEDYIRDRIANGERPPDSAADRLRVDEARKQRDKPR
jgi:hypothetical protein